jgi:hypothetical protein
MIAASLMGRVTVLLRTSIRALRTKRGDPFAATS